MLSHRYYFIALAMFLVFQLNASMYHQPVPEYQALLNRPEYKKLKTEFGKDQLQSAFINYSDKNYTNSKNFQDWSGIADSVIGRYYFEQERRYFLVNVILHDMTKPEELSKLYNFFNAHKKATTGRGIKTDQGTVYTKMQPDQYKDVMEVSNDIRSKVFNNVSPLVLVRKSEGELSISTKWSLFKFGAAIVYLISLCFNKDEKNEKGEKIKSKNNSLFSVLELSDRVEEMEKFYKKYLEESFPVLKKYTVQSLVDDRTFWLYDRKNWIKGGSALAMILLTYGLIYDKLPDIQPRVYSVILVA